MVHAWRRPYKGAGRDNIRGGHRQPRCQCSHSMHSQSTRLAFMAQGKWTEVPQVVTLQPMEAPLISQMAHFRARARQYS